MFEFFECKYYWNEFINIFESQSINYLSYENGEKRADASSRIKDLSQNNRVIQHNITYNYDQDTIEINKDGRILSLRANMSKFLKELNKEDVLIIDITAMNLRVVGALLNGIKILKFTKIFCVYTEPHRYKKTNNIVHKEFESYNDVFELYNKFKGVMAIPGFLRSNDNSLKEKWIVLLGFEQKRIMQLNEEYGFKDITPVVTLPSFKPGWQNYVFYSNMDFIKSTDRKPDYIAANSFLDTYEYLYEIHKTYPDNYLRITPLGTKVNALGALLFSLNFRDNVEILFDNPKDEVFSDGRIGLTYLFDISEVINWTE